MNWIRKYHNQPVKVAGIQFDSKLEAAVYNSLLLRENANEIKILKCQDVVRLSAAEIRYEPDFKCLDIQTNQEFHVESKGFETDRWPTIKKLWKAYGPGMLEIWKGTYQKPLLEKIIVPQANLCPHCGHKL